MLSSSFRKSTSNFLPNVILLIFAARHHNLPASGLKVATAGAIKQDATLNAPPPLPAVTGVAPGILQPLGNFLGMAAQRYFAPALGVPKTYNPSLAMMPAPQQLVGVTPSPTDSEPSEPAGKTQEARKTDPFQNIAALSMKIRRIATQLPDVASTAGIYSVKYSPTKDFTMKSLQDSDLAQGASDVSNGSKTPCALSHQKEEESAIKDIEDKQKIAEKGVGLLFGDAYQSQYLEQEKQRLKREISIQKRLLKLAKKDLQTREKAAKKSEAES